MNFKNAILFRNKSLMLLTISRLASTFAFQMLAVTVGWQMFSITNSNFYLGLVGLVQFIPMLLFTFPAGHVADKYNRKVVIALSQTVEAASVLVLAFFSLFGLANRESLLILCFCFGAANSFQGPSMQSLLPNIVERETFSKAVALTSSVSQVGVIVGPGLGGVLYALGPDVAYFIIAGLLLVSALSATFIVLRPADATDKPRSEGWRGVVAGLAYIRSKPAIFGAISLDLFAVLLGGATALLPAYATILHAGPVGLGILRSAPAVGALLVTVFLTRWPIKVKAGRKMFAAVILFGISTIVFAISKSMALSIAAMVVLGASDVVSVVIRGTFVQIETPDALRGRVSSVNQLFIGASNQLGEFESGVAASLLGGAVPAALLGGIGTIVVALVWMGFFPSLRRVDQI